MSDLANQKAEFVHVLRDIIAERDALRERCEEQGNAIAGLQAIKIQDDRKKRIMIEQLEKQKEKIEFLTDQNRQMQGEIDSIHALRDIPIKLTWKEMAAVYRTDYLRAQAQVVGLKTQVKRWAARAKALEAKKS